MKKTLKASLIVAAAFAFGCAAVACGEDDDKKKPSEPTKYTVAYELGSGVTGTAPAGGKYAAGAKFDVAALPSGITNGEFVFGGWNDGTNVYQAGAEYTMPAHDVTFTAKWDDNSQTVTYTVTYNLNGGTGTAPTESNKAAGATFKIAASDGISKNGFVFDGWSDGTTKYAAEANYTMPAQNVTFTAQWKEQTPVGETYKVTYDLRRGLGTKPTESDKAEGDTFALDDATKFANDDYDFVGWNDGKKTYNAGDTYTMPKADVTLVAQWTPKAGDPLPTGEDVYILEYSGDYTLPEKRSTMQNIEGGENIVGIAIRDSDKSLYYKIKGSTGWMKSKIKYSSASTAYMPDKYGANAHYYEGRIGAINYYALFNEDYSKLTLCDSDDNIFEGNSEFTLVGGEETDNVTVTFDIGYSGYGVENPAAQTIAKGGKLTAVDTPTRTGYTFGGWHVGTADGAVFDIANDVVNESMTLVAAWTVNAETYTATFVGGKGVVGTVPEPIEISASAKFPEGEQLSRGDFEFIGWMDSERDDSDPESYTFGLLYSPGSAIRFSSNKTFLAVFGKTYAPASDPDYNSSYMIRTDGILVEDPNGNYESYYTYTMDGDMITYTPYYEVKFKIDDSNNTYALYDGWDVYDITADDGTTKLVLDGFGTVTFAGNTGSYSVLGGVVRLAFGADEFELSYEYGDDYSPLASSMFGKITLNGTTYTFGNPINVTFSLGDGVEGTAPDAQLVKANGKAKEPTAPTREGYLFKAWHVGSVDGAVFDFDTAITADTTLVAEWVEPVTVTFSLGEGVEGTAPTAQKVLPGGTATAPKAPTRTGYVFKAWHLAAVDGEVFDFTTAVNSDITLVAEWEVKVMGALLYDYAGEGSGNSVKYGYASASEATAANKAFTVSTNATPPVEKTIYYATAYYISPSASYNAGKLTISLCWGDTSSTKFYTTQIKVDGTNQNVTDHTLTNQEVLVIGTSSYGKPEIKVNFSIIDSKRAITITLGDQTVTWTEMTA